MMIGAGEVPIHNPSTKNVSESFVITTKSPWKVFIHIVLTEMFIKPFLHLDIELIYLDLSRIDGVTSTVKF